MRHIGVSVSRVYLNRPRLPIIIHDFQSINMNNHIFTGYYIVVKLLSFTCIIGKTIIYLYILMLVSCVRFPIHKLLLTWLIVEQGFYVFDFSCVKLVILDTFI